MVKIPKEKYDSEVACCEAEEAHYPWGTEIQIQDDLVEKLKAGDYAVGQEVTVVAKAIVSRKSEDNHESLESEGRHSKSISFQITDIEIGAKEGDFAEKLYKDQS